MLDIVFWWCALVALAGSAALVGVALLFGRGPQAVRVRVRPSAQTPSVVRRFGRA
ncbi:hypothetical protein [Methylobacterium sp. J-070]|uniref:hypothetical protein n=1 Tax=Methylobacterium sp. J-070 TaxID=2836650 RepID=UPI001FB9F969|nr:hypothetical protein [Methylobacterium sp. J-070]MCJ2052461.1 hypothetical protein [Methylobacterium sp. J-070]